MRVFAMVFAGLGGTIMIFATWEALHRRRKERTGQHVRAKVVEIIVERVLNRGGSGDMNFPVFEFVAADGRSVRHQSTFGNGTPTYSVGDEIVVWHDAADPEQCDIVGEGRGFALVLALLGFIFLAVGAAIRVFASFDREVQTGSGRLRRGTRTASRPVSAGAARPSVG